MKEIRQANEYINFLSYLYIIVIVIIFTVRLNIESAEKFLDAVAVTIRGHIIYINI